MSTALIEDVIYCSSSFLMYRTIADENKCFTRALSPRHYTRGAVKAVNNSFELENVLWSQVQEACADKRAALALSGGMDSAVLAKMMPPGSAAYTFKCVVPGVDVTDETQQAACYAHECGLEHHVVEITWADMEEYAPLLMKAKGAPIHSIEIQIAKAALQAKSDGFDTLIFGESADNNYGGLSSVLSQDWTFGEYVDRYSYVLPYKVLRDWVMDLSVFEPYVVNGYIDVHEHFRTFSFRESMGSYDNATAFAGMQLCVPYAKAWMGVPLDLARVRKGENKYFIREIFSRLYPCWEVPTKVPMPRPMNEWMADWEGPTRPEFWPHCTDGMTGDQKWLVWALERFLNLLDAEVVEG